MKDFSRYTFSDMHSSNHRSDKRNEPHKSHITMTNTQIIEEAAQRSFELISNIGDYEKDFKFDSFAFQKAERACRVSFNIDGQKYRVQRQSEWQAGNPKGKIVTRYYIVKTVGKRVVKEKDSPIKLAKILETAKTVKEQALSNQDAIRETLGKVLLPF